MTMAEETKRNEENIYDYNEYLDVINDLKIIDNYPNLAKYLVKPKERLERKLRLLTA